MGAGMPILYFLVFLNMFVVFLVDKFQLFHFFVKPLQTTKALNKIFIWLILTFVFIHFLFSFWIVSSDEFLGDKLYYETNLAQSTGQTLLFFKLIKKIFTIPGISFIALAGFIFVILVFRYII